MIRNVTSDFVVWLRVCRFKRNGLIDQRSARLLWRLHLQWPYRDSNCVVAAYSRVYPEEMAAVALALVASHLSGRCLCYGRSRTLHCGCPHCLLRHHSRFLDVSHHGQQYHLEGWWNLANKNPQIFPFFNVQHLFFPQQNGPSNYLSRLWWYCIFTYFERNVGGVVPRRYEWPLPWPRHFLSKYPDRNS